MEVGGGGEDRGGGDDRGGGEDGGAVSSDVVADVDADSVVARDGDGDRFLNLLGGLKRLLRV